jgi:hypothetical protein
MNKEFKTALDKPLGGLSLMTLLTIIWTIVGEISLKGEDFYVLGIIFFLILFFFTSFYFTFNKRKKFLPKIHNQEDPKKEKLYWIILIAEGVAILVVQNILANISKDELFIPCFVLIVGLHFFPLAKVFDRKFDYYIGTWTTFFALLGIYLTTRHSMHQYFINAIVCFACATATTLYGLYMISNAKKIYSDEIETNASP